MHLAQRGPLRHGQVGRDLVVPAWASALLISSHVANNHREKQASALTSAELYGTADVQCSCLGRGKKVGRPAHGRLCTFVPERTSKLDRRVTRGCGYRGAVDTFVAKPLRVEGRLTTREMTSQIVRLTVGARATRISLGGTE